MKINSKTIEELVEEDLLEIEKNPIFEDLYLEFKYKYNKKEDELRKIIIQFANTDKGGIIFYGVSENPLKFVGLEYKIIDNIKNHINNILTSRIDPVLSPFPRFYTIGLSNGKYILCLEVFPKENGIYGIRLNDNPSSSMFNVYEFYTRLDGAKHQMKIEEVVNLIEGKSKGTKILETKNLKVTILEPIMLDTNVRYISLKAVNKGVRPIVVTAFGIRSVKYGTYIDTYLKKLVRRKLCTPLPKKLSDGEACIALYPRKYIESNIKRLNWDYPLELKAYFNTNDGIFYSESIKLSDLSKYDKYLKKIKFVSEKKNSE